MKDSYPLLVITGPTASGKTSVAAHLADRLNGEIISADSRQVYRGMNLGTGKDLEEYELHGRQIPYHLIDILDAGEVYNVFEFQKDAFRCLDEIRSRGKNSILCGGTGMYIDAILNSYHFIQVPANPERRQELEQWSDQELIALLKSLRKLHNSTDTDSKKRLIRAIEIEEYSRIHNQVVTSYPSVKSLVIGIDISREERRRRISQRLEQRLKQGMVDEVKNLLDSGISPDALLFYGLEYKYLTLYLLGTISYDEMKSQLEIAIHQFAKRQMTWFRKMEKEGTHIHWMDGMLPLEAKIVKIRELLAESGLELRYT